MRSNSLFRWREARKVAFIFNEMRSKLAQITFVMWRTAGDVRIFFSAIWWKVYVLTYHISWRYRKFHRTCLIANQILYLFCFIHLFDQIHRLWDRRWAPAHSSTWGQRSCLHFQRNRKSVFCPSWTVRLCCVKPSSVVTPAGSLARLVTSACHHPMSTRGSAYS